MRTILEATRRDPWSAERIEVRVRREVDLDVDFAATHLHLRQAHEDGPVRRRSAGLGDGSGPEAVALHDVDLRGEEEELSPEVDPGHQDDDDAEETVGRRRVPELRPTYQLPDDLQRLPEDGGQRRSE